MIQLIITLNSFISQSFNLLFIILLIKLNFRGKDYKLLFVIVLEIKSLGFNNFRFSDNFIML